MTKTSSLQSILIDTNKRIYLVLGFLLAFCLFHLLVKPFQLSYYSSQDFIRVNIAYNLIALLSVCIGFIAIPKYFPAVFLRMVGSVFNRITYLLLFLFSIGLGVFIFKITFGYYDFTLARVGTGIFAISAFCLPIGFIAYTADTKINRTQVKEWSELTYWRIQKIKNPKLPNDHYEAFYTETFGLKLEDYENRKVLDIGCGPRGSLEWAPNSTVAIGLDPLAQSYVNMYPQTKPWRMQLVQGYCEAIPFEDNHFDVVSSFNSIDHVEDLPQSINEIQRVIKPGGLFLLICDVNRKTTVTEPHSITPHLLIQRFDKLTLENEKLVQPIHKFRIYANVKANIPLQNVNDQGVLIAKFRKI